ncbi:MAG: energy-coupling factor transporter transmembrane component T [Candidatus Caldarchaeum sp.]
MLLVIAISVAALSVLDFYINLAILAVSLVLLLIARVPLRNLKIWMYGFAFMLSFLTVMYTFLSKVPGEIIYFQFPWGTYISENTLTRALSVAFRIWSMIFAALIFLATTTDSDILVTLSKLRIPYTFSFLLSLSLRSIQVFGDDWKTIIEAYWSRGVDVNRGGIIARLKNYTALAIPLIIITLNRVKDIDFAAEARGFRLGIRNRTYIDRFRWTVNDTALSVTSAAIILLTLLLTAL